MSNKIKVVTYNVRNEWLGDGINAFIHRQGMVVDKFRAEAPDVICIQEGMPKIIEALKSSLLEYTFIFNGRNSDFGGEGLCVAFRNETMELCGLDCFWHSKTPYVAGSKDEGSVCPRICQRAMLKHLGSGELFNFYNVHFDFITPEIRLVQAKELMEQVKEAKQRYDTPFFILGDFNARPNEPTISYFNNEAPFKMKDLTDEFKITFHQYGNYEENGVKLSGVKIDYIYYNSNETYSYKTECWTDVRDGIYLSDHYPVSVVVEF